MMNAVLCRYGELFLKSGNRSFFERTLADNVAGVLEGLSADVHTPHGRIVVRVPEASVDDACARLERVFGLVSVSPALILPPHMDDIRQAAVRAAGAALERDPALRRSFRVDARRSDKRFALTSGDIARDIGAAVAEATRVPVDLTDAALIVGIEVGAAAAYVFVETRAAPGGLPVTSSGRALLLLSGGIDSPVAGWLAAKRGLGLDALYFHSPPFVGEKSRDKVIALGRALARWHALRSIRVVSFTQAQERLREAGPPALAVVLYRRMMMRVADLIAEGTGAQALVTGENLGQVASQTITNLHTIEAAARRLVLRPLLTYDKMDTVELAKRIGTYETSILPYEDCCSLFVPPHPSTAARLADVERAEACLDMAAEAAAVAATAETVIVPR